MIAGEYDKALEYLKNEPLEDKRPEVAQEIAFTRAYCMAQLTLSGDVDLKDAAVQMMAFPQELSEQLSLLQGLRIAGRPLRRGGRLRQAQEQYAKLSQAPWPDYQIRGTSWRWAAPIWRRTTRRPRKRPSTRPLGNSAPGPLADLQRTAAQIGKARCMILTGRADEALNSLNVIIEKLDDRNPEINALAYNAQGTALRKAGKLDKAVLAFLRVHLMYDLQPDAHAEAVANLEKLFKETHRPQHAARNADHPRRALTKQPLGKGQ